MAVTSELRFLGTGEPARPGYQPRISREPSRTGILRSGKTRVSEFHDANQQRIDAATQELGQRAQEIQRIIPAGRLVDLLV